MDDTSIVLFALNIAGAAALLIWAVRLLQTGVERTYAVQLCALLRRSNASRLRAAASGIFAALCLQSATAVADLVSNSALKGGVGLLAGLAMLLGADIGFAIDPQILLVRQDFLVPMLLLCGVVLFLCSSKNEVLQLGRILIGVALIFVSLGMIRYATGPLIDSPPAISVVRYLGGDVVTSFVIGGLFAWAVHSSVAAVLFFVTLNEVELRWLVSREFAQKAEDVDWRRTKLGLLMSDREIEALEKWMHAEQGNREAAH